MAWISLALAVRCDRIGRSSYTLTVEMSRDGEVLCVAEMTYVRAADGASVALSEGFRARLKG